ncbi:MAG: ABC transporter ATP-binding protein [Myxococcales bacterium]|nr:ABC transporter ATP-binding protein [Myxococcales bacterium]MDH5306285.1 ABC transporter ATP-binding protein [Myxococcales bacterium]MDH5565042.1 ABC transporter ATP-binding protein [Myxococcales bacterium]
MQEPAIRIEDLGKRYRLGSLQPLSALRARLAGAGRGAPAEAADPLELWALRDLHLTIAPAEIVGVIGANGAGKSTLLKILSRITAPTRGRVEIRGRVGSLLEVGTGFHPELTGRENIYLNGAILGMKRAEIDAQLDEIVAFSQVERFLDTPAKRYSSGMRLRLAFAIAAHLEPEILIIDEVLAVGDAAFQRKCLGKMSDVALRGRTVLFVSHNMNAVANLCTRVAWLRDGQLAFDGAPSDAIRAYLDSIRAECRALRSGGAGRYDLRAASRNGNQARSRARAIESFSIRDEHGALTDVVASGAPVRFEIGYRHAEALARPTFGILIEKSDVGNLVALQTHIQHGPLDKLPASGRVRCEVRQLPLAPGAYTLSVGMTTGGEQLDWVERYVELEVQPADVYGTGRLPNPRHGAVLVQATWSFP